MLKRLNKQSRSAAAQTQAALRGSHEWYAGHSIALSGVTAVSPMHTNARRQSDAVQRCRKIRTSVHKQVRRQVQKQDSRERVRSGSGRTVPEVREARERKRARRLHQTCLRGGVPADSEVQSQVRKDGYPHLVEASSSRKTVPKISKTWELQPACMPERERERVIRTREGE